MILIAFSYENKIKFKEEKKMAKKLTSLMLAFAMASAILPASAMAEETNESLTLKNFNATTKVITVDFNNVTASLDSTDLASKITISKRTIDGTQSSIVSDFSVNVTEAMTGTGADGAETTTAEGNSIIITPTQGIDTQCLYKVTIAAGVADSDGTALAEDASTGWFKVNELFADDFNAEGKYTITEDAEGTKTYTAEAPYYWTADNYLQSIYYNNSKPAWVQIANTNVSGGTKNPNTLMWILNGGSISISEEAIAADERETDYTVEYTYKYPTGQHNNPGHTLSMRATPTTSGAMYNASTGYAIMLRQDAAASTAATVDNPSAPVKLKVGGATKYTTANFAPENGLVDIRMSTVGNNIQCYLNNNKMIDIVDETYTSAGTTGISDAINTPWSNPCYIDNLSVTTVIKVGDEIPQMTLEGFNADSTGIALDFGGNVREIVKETINFEIYKNNTLVPESDYTWQLNGDEAEIVFNDGVEIGSLYEVKIAAGMADSSGISIPSDEITTGGFIVEEIYSNTFDNAESVAAWDMRGASYEITDGKLVSTGEVDRCGIAGLTQYADYTTEADFTLTATKSDFRLNTRASSYRLYYSESTKYTVRFVHDGVILYAPNASKETEIMRISKAIELNKEHHARVVNKGTRVKVYLDNEVVIDIEDSTVTSEGTFCMRMNGTTYMDNLMLTKVTPIDIPQKAEIASYNADSDTVYLEIGGTDISVNSIPNAVLGGVKLYDKNGTELSADVSVLGNHIIIKPQGGITPNQKYTVKATGITTKCGTVIADYEKSFKLVEIYKNSFDENIDDWGTREIGSWDNGRMKLSNTSDSTVDYIYSNTFKGTTEPEYSTELDLYIYDNDDNSETELTFNQIMVYSNKVHKTAYNQGANTLNFGIGKTRNLQIRNGGLTLLYDKVKSSNFTIEEGNTYKLKIVNKNGTGMFYVNGILEATYDYSEYAPLTKGCLGFNVGANTVAGIDNILCTYVADVTDEGGEGTTPAISITGAEISAPDTEGKVTADITVQNNTYEGKEYVVAVALYDAENKLVGVKTAKETAAVQGESKPYNLTIENVAAYSYANVFLWSGLDTMNPIGTMRNISGTTKTSFYVNPSADITSADGSAENPYNSINAAIERINDEVLAGAFNVNFTVDVAEGEYFLNDTLKINDYSGVMAASGSSITIKGQGSDKTYLKSGSVISADDFYKVTDSKILERIVQNARNNIYAVDLLGKGYVEEDCEKIELALNGKIQTTAKYPNNGYLKTGEVTEDKMSFICSDERVNAWQTANDMYIYYMPNYFSYAYKVTAQNGMLTTENNAGFLKGKNYYVYNLIEELDCTGEYFYDKTSGILYVYSENGISGEYEIFNMNKSLIALEYCDRVKVKDMTIENSGETLVSLQYTKNSGLENCILRNGSKSAVKINGAYNSGLLNCDVYDMGEGGVSISGGNRDILSKGRNYVNKCSVHDCQRLDRSYKALISLSGVGNYIVNSDIYNSYHQAVTIYGNDLEIKNNKIYNVCTETADMGAIYAEGDWTLRGTVIEHNYFENVPSNGAMGAFAVYLDNGLSGATVQKNIFKDIDRQAVYINGGRDNKVINNIFVDSGSIGAISDIYNWGSDENGNNYNFENPKPANSSLINKLNKIKYNEEPYTKYEHLTGILEDKPSIPKYNVFSENVLVNTGEISTAWLRNTPLDVLLTEGGCEYSVYKCNKDDLNDYNGGDYTLSSEKAEELGFTAFDNVFGR